MGFPVQQTMTDVLPQTDPAALPRHQSLHDKNPPQPSITSHPNPPILPALSTSNGKDNALPPVNTDVGQEDDGVIACICAFNTDDGNTIQCDKCMRWQHILCYYPPPEQTPDEASAHYCIDCQPRHIDAQKATERQRKALNERDAEQDVEQLPVDKKPTTKSHKKKSRDSPSITTQLNGLDRHGHLLSADAKSASPRDSGPPAAKRPKIAHKPSEKSNNTSRRRATNSAANTPASGNRSQSPDLPTQIIPQYSREFLHLFHTDPRQVETATNLMNDIAITNSLSEWLIDSKAVSKATRGLSPSDIFQRWPGRIEDIPGSPEVAVRWVEDPRFTADGVVPRWAQLAVEDQLAPRAFIGELRGRVCHIDHYYANPENRWQYLRHPLPFVFFHPQLPICIDARQEGSIFRFVRRSCDPNAKLQTIITEGTEYHFCFMAIKDIMPGDEITVAWSVPESVSEKIKTSFGQTNNVQPSVRIAISDWVSKVLANCGPCACNGGANCLMAHYDRRGQPLPKVRRGKKSKSSQVDPVVGEIRSRSVSETTHKQESHDDGPGDGSNSATPGSDSRDMTPHAHDPSSAGGTLLPEMSERERKKLMREEEMFRKQEEANDKQKKKRPSGGSTLNTPMTATPMRVRGSIDSSGGLPHRRSPGDSAVTPGNDTGSGKPSHGKRKHGQMSGRRKSSIIHTPRPQYVDASVQCDMDKPDDDALSALPKRRYISLTQKLLRRCTLNNLERRSSLTAESPKSPQEVSSTTDLQTEHSKLKVNGVGHLKVEPISDPVETGSPIAASSDTRKTEVETTDVDMRDATSSPVTSDVHQSPASKFAVAPPSITSPPQERPSDPETADMTLAIAPVAGQIVPPINKSEEDVEMKVAIPSQAEEAKHRDDSDQREDETRNAQISSSFESAQPNKLTDAAPAPVFSPSVTAAVAPSPIRKKLSLSDYTKRSKARPSMGEATPGGILTPSSTLTADPMSAESATIADILPGDVATPDTVEAPGSVSSIAGRLADGDRDVKPGQ